jgi:hypothetical protein
VGAFSKSIQVISILAIIAPISIGIANWKISGSLIRSFVVFLFIGLATDVSMYTLLNSNKTEYLPDIFNFYSLVESIFFYWIVLKNVKAGNVRVIIKVLLWITLLYWLLLYTAEPLSPFFQTPGRFDAFYEIVISFLAGLALLQLVEKDDNIVSNPMFWILLGIFFYCFCTFFIMNFITTLISQRIWFLNNIFNIIAYLFYSIGLWKSNAFKRNAPISQALKR